MAKARGGRGERLVSSCGAPWCVHPPHNPPKNTHLGRQASGGGNRIATWSSEISPWYRMWVRATRHCAFRLIPPVSGLLSVVPRSLLAPPRPVPPRPA